MSNGHSSPPAAGEATRAETMTALFANLVIQQTNMALMFLGQVPNPETGERVQNFDAARMFIDQLEMLEVKTKGNLDKQETQLLNQSLTTLRLAFVEAIESGPDKAAAAPTSPPAADQAASSPEPKPAPETSAGAEEHRTKFSKKY